MIKSTSRFFLVLAVAILLGTSLYLAIHAVQPLVNRGDSERAERPENVERAEAESNSFTTRDLLFGVLSIGRDVFVFAVITGIVVAIQQLLPKARRVSLEPDETSDTN